VDSLKPLIINIYENDGENSFIPQSYSGVATSLTNERYGGEVQHYNTTIIVKGNVYYIYSID